MKNVNNSENQSETEEKAIIPDVPEIKAAARKPAARKPAASKAKITADPAVSEEETVPAPVVNEEEIATIPVVSEAETAPAPSAEKEEELVKVPEAVETEALEEAAPSETSEHHGSKRLDKMKKQKLCKLVKNNSLKKHPEEYQALVSDAAYICLKCGRVAKDKSSLCKPMAMKTL